jgi:hypothetical protein
MATNKSVLISGFDPKFLDFSSPELAPLNLTVEKVNAGTAAEFERLRGLGYEPDGRFVDLGETAEIVVASQFRAKEYGCVIIGAGVRGQFKVLPPVREAHERCPRSRRRPESARARCGFLEP